MLGGELGGVAVSAASACVDAPDGGLRPHLDVRRRVRGLRRQRAELHAQAGDGADPRERDQEEEEPDVRGGRRQGAEEEYEELLDERAAGLPHPAGDDVDRRLALRLLLGVERDVGHLLRRVEHAVLGRLRPHVLRRPDEDGEHEGRLAHRRGQRAPQGREEDQGEEADAGGEADHGRAQGREAPAEPREEALPDKHEDNGDNARRGGVHPHERRVVVRGRVLELQAGLPGHLDEVDGHAVADDDDAEVQDVRRGHEVPDALHHAHVRLGLRLLRLRLLHEVRVVDDIPLHVGERGDHARPGEEAGRDEVHERQLPRVGALLDRRRLPHLRDVGNEVARDDECHVRKHPEKRVELFRFRDVADLVGEAPEKEAENHRAPELRHEVEKAEGPEPDHGHRPEERARQHLEEPVAERVRVDQVLHRVEDEGEGPEEHEEEDRRDVEDRRLGADGTEAHIHGEKNDRPRDQHVGLQKRDGLCARTSVGHDEDVFRVAENRVVEEHHEENYREGQHLLHLIWREIAPQPLGAEKARPLGRARALLHDSP
mmetsp:Transcript_57105/g.161221  ORF Transcript_57105/g.161221 Transcript_57105/m.161221 type:complete len:544 (-) Transcript_57105:59-1690(-)